MWGLSWPVGAITCAAWLLLAALFRYSSLAALAAAVIVPIALYFISTPQIAGLFAVMSLIVIIKHHANISRLLAGTEGKIGAKG
jgi:glycerol-3-phosphate acyltransferase PlsY